MLAVGLEVRLPRVEESPLLALMCGWLWRGRCACREMSYTLCCASSVVAALLLPPKPPGPWLLSLCLFMLQPCPCLCCRRILPSCRVVGVAALPLWELGGEWGGRGSLLQHQAPPAAPRVTGQVCLWVQPLFLLPACFSQNGLGRPKQGRRLLMGLSLKEGSRGRGSETCGGCWGWQPAGTSVCAPPAGWLRCLSAKWGLLRSPASSFRGTSRGLRSSSGTVCCQGGGGSLGPWLCTPGSHSLGWCGRCPFNGSETWSSAPSLIFCCCQRW